LIQPEDHLNIISPQPGMVGIINVKMTLKEVIERWCHFVQEIAESRYGTVPAIRISGHVTARFPYIEMPVNSPKNDLK
jgi:[3-methyl-2-oxobutanoate dehydrogenase (acetyl-transferring)] kinase